MRRNTLATIVLASALAPPICGAPPATYPGRFFPIAPSDLAIGDVDGDGDDDLVGTAIGGLATLRNDGKGHYTLLPLSIGPQGASKVILAHLDIDGKLDAVVGTLSGVYALPGDGLGGFGPVFTLLSGFQNGTPRVADLNEDGHPDVVIGNQTAGAGFRVFFGSGAGPVSGPITIAGGQGGAQVELVDLNGDSKLDVLAVGPAINSWLGDGAGNFVLAAAPPHAGTAPIFVRGDFDQDAIADLFAFPLFSTFGEFWKGAANGTFSGPTATSLVSASYSVIDFDQDGLPDLARYDSVTPGRLRVDRCVGPALFAAPIHLPVEETVSRAYSHDADQDGDLDLWVQGSGLTRLECRGPGDFVTTHLEPIVDPASVVFGDVNDDGQDDLVVARSAGEIGVALASGAGDYGAFGFSSPSGLGNAVDLGLADLDLDGDLDVLSLSVTQVFAHHGDGAGGFARVQSQSLLSGLVPIRLEIGDGNGDGYPDLFYIESGPGPFGSTLGSLRGYEGSPSGILGAPIALFSANAAPEDLTLGDFDSDGAADVMIAVNHGVSYFESNGTGGFLTQQILSTPGAQVLRIDDADLDGNGDRDLVLLDRLGSGGVRSLMKTAGGFVITPVVSITAIPNAYSSLEAGDADGDGRPDAVVLGESGSSTILDVVRGDGGGTFNESIPHSVCSPAFVNIRLRLFDGDHDGRVDAGFASADRDHVEILKGSQPPYFAYTGTGCAGSGDFTPRLRLDGAATPGGVVALSLENGFGGATAMFFTGLQFASVPLPGGCPLLVFPLLPIVFQLPLPNGGPGDGAFALLGPLPGSLTSGSSYVFQALVIDPGAPFGFSATNAAKLTVR